MKRNKNRTEDGQKSLERRLSLLNDSVQMMANQVYSVCVCERIPSQIRYRPQHSLNSCL